MSITTKFPHDKTQEYSRSINGDLIDTESQDTPAVENKIKTTISNLKTPRKINNQKLHYKNVVKKTPNIEQRSCPVHMGNSLRMGAEETKEYSKKEKQHETQEKGSKSLKAGKGFL